ncbi:AbrB family transcriptional regulator [Orrella daihaiensis]|uniref:AbrB family transcriptional regulator n=1 Tax=Orrella daihaiensis TaxID=2782176 RepID=A0ABY4AJR8_9BURK|nr:AbrB family transcriptional regulator [Orrella daihaiensis]UOD50534.1 AbrB family transcriptional regulator [Orrella daihaiensis]
MFSHFAFRVVFGGVASLVGALLAQLANVPLPWLLGPLFFVGALRLMSAPISTIKPLRNVGQWIIGVSLGLYFSPEIGRLILDHWFALLIGMLVALLLGVFGTWLLCRLGRVDVKTAWFSSAIGGASEMSVLAERYGARVDLVASAHSLRVLAVVTIIPFGFEFAGISGSDASVLSLVPLNYIDLSMTGLVALIAGFLFARLRITSAWVLGPLTATAILSLTEFSMTTVPSWFINSGQLFLGWSIGDRYRPAFFKAAPRFMSAVAIFSVMSICIVAVIGLLAAKLTGLALPTIWLGMAPGGLAEMAITAKVLLLGVPMVTAFQVSRMAFVVLSTGAIYKWLIEPRVKHSTNN